MTEARRDNDDSRDEGVVVPFPVQRMSPPPPLPPLRHTYPTPGMGVRSGAVFNAVASLRFEQDAA